jgi:hypothetical protein
MSTPAAPRLAAAGAADAGKDTEMMRKRIEALRVQAASLMEELPSILKSKDGNYTSFCQRVVPVLMHDSTASIVEHLRSSKSAEHNKAPNGDSKDGLLDLRQYKTWGDACGSIVEALNKCVSHARVAEQGGELQAMSALNGTNGQWNIVGCESWRDFGDGEVNVVADGNTLRLATCRKCQRVVSQQRFAAHWELCQNFDYSRVQERSPTNLGAGGSAAGGALKIKIGMGGQKQQQLKVAPGAPVVRFFLKLPSLLRFL